MPRLEAAASNRGNNNDAPSSIATADEKSFVQFTGLATAYLRAAESSRPDRIINDRFAEALAGDVGAQFLAFVNKWGPSQENAVDMLAIRTRYLDEALSHKSQVISQVVLLAAGMDTRAFRLDALRGAHVFEIDQSSDMLEQKQRVFQSMDAAPVAAKIDYIVSDLAADAWELELQTHGFDATKPTFWCMEGLLYYLDRSSIVKLLKTVDAHSAPGSELWVDMCGASALKEHQLGKMQGLKFGEDNPIDGILSILHWDLRVVASFDKPGTHFGRAWEPLKLSNDPNDDDENVLQWCFISGTKPAHQDVAPLL